MRIKTCPVQIKAIDGDDDTSSEGVFEALVAVFGNVDAVGDTIVKGAFADTLAAWRASGDPIPVYWSHRMDDPDYCIGHVLAAKETDDGLWVRAQLDLDTPKAVTTYRLLKSRRVTQFSHVEAGEGESYTELRKLTLHEVGPTPIGANPATELLEVKSASGEPVPVVVTSASPAEATVIRQALTQANAGPERAVHPSGTLAKVGRVLSAQRGRPAGRAGQDRGRRGRHRIGPGRARHRHRRRREGPASAARVFEGANDNGSERGSRWVRPGVAASADRSGRLRGRLVHPVRNREHSRAR